MSDLIKRHDAIGKIKDWMKFIGYSHSERNVMECTIQMLEELPSEQKTGKWITKSDTNPYYTTWWYECSECGQKPLRNGYEQEVLSDYCPNCGSRNRGEEDTILYFALCLDEDKKCPKECFRRQLNEDLKKNPQPRVSWMHFEGTEECMKGGEQMSELISRQDVIDAVIKYCTKYDLRELLADIEVLPSVPDPYGEKR